MKKFFSLVLALVMALSLTTVAWGADPVAKVGTTEYDVLQDAVNAAASDASKTVTLLDDVTVTATTIGSQLVGIEVPAGVTVDGDGYTLTVDGAYSSAGGTNCAVLFHGGTLKDIAIVGGNRCLYVTNVQEDIILDGVVLVTEGSYGINVNDGDAPFVELKATNTVFSGWNSYGTAVTKATFENCEFVWNTAGTYAVLRPYNDTVVEDCNFADGAEISTDELVDGETVELENVTVDGEPVTAANLSTLLGTAHTDVAVTSVATTSYNVYDANGNLVKANTTYTLNDGTPYDRDTGMGEVEYYTIDGMAGKFVEVSKADKADADYYVTLVGQSGVRMYLKQVNNTVYEKGYEFTNIGDDCGELNVSKKYDYYYTKNADGTQDFWKGEKDTAGSYALMVAGELVQVSSAGDTSDLVAHDWEIKTVNDDHEVTSIACEECGVVANVYESKLAAPKGAFETVYGWAALVAPTASTTPSTDKVQSAETFDAGIAMYVGMSVMAAAGSAVVIGKKRED